MLRTLRRWLAIKIFPEFHAEQVAADNFRRAIWSDLDELYHTFGTQFPETRYAVHWVLTRSGYFTTDPLDTTLPPSIYQLERGMRKIEDARLRHLAYAILPENFLERWRGLFKIVEESGELLTELGRLGAFPAGEHPGHGDVAKNLAGEMADVHAALYYFGEQNGITDDRNRMATKLEKFRQWKLTGVMVKGDTDG